MEAKPTPSKRRARFAGTLPVRVPIDAERRIKTIAKRNGLTTSTVVRMAVLLQLPTLEAGMQIQERN